MKILLIYPAGNAEIIGWGDLGAIAEPLALEYLAGAARAGGHEVEILDLRLHPDDLELTLIGFQPEVVGVTGYSMHVLRNLDICARTKAMLPSCRTIVGGHHATLMPEDFFAPQLDAVVVGEGVRPFTIVLAAWAEGREVRGVAGVWSRVDGAFEFGGAQPAPRIDEIPPPDRTLVPHDRERYFIDWMKPIALLRTTLGCPYRCSFCSLWKIMEGRYLKRDIQMVVDELRQIPERYVFMVDDEPFVNPQRMWALARAIEDANIHKEYFAYCRVDSFLRDLDLMRTWRSLGLSRVFFGIEAVLDTALADYNKRQEKDQIRAALRAAKAIGIHVFSSFIVRPDYSRDDFRQLIAFIRDNEIEYPSFNILTPIPGTGMLDAGFDQVTIRQPNGRPNWEYFDLQHAVLETRLPLDEFMREYRGLQAVFSDAYQRAQHPMFTPEAIAAFGAQPSVAPLGPPLGAPPILAEPPPAAPPILAEPPRTAERRRLPVVP